MINEFDKSVLCTDNYSEHKAKMSELSVSDLIKAYDYIMELSTFIPANNEVLDELEEVTGLLENTFCDLVTEERCSHCNSYLYKSDLPQYDYVCPNCDENF